MPPVELPGVAQIVTAGKTVLIGSTTASAVTAVPTNLNGTAPKVVRVTADHFCHIKFGPNSSATSCANSDILINPNSGPEFFNVLGAGFFSVCLDTNSATTAQVNLCAVEGG